MSQSEFALLGIGLILGLAAGVALVGIVRKKPQSKREVRVTVAPDAVPRRRAATLANDAFTDSPVAIAPAVGGPADTSRDGRGDGRTPAAPSTSVLQVTRPGQAPAVGSSARAGRPRVGVAQAVPVTSGVDPMLSALRASAAASAEAAMQAVAAAAVKRGTDTARDEGSAARGELEAVGAVASTSSAAATADTAPGGSPGSAVSDRRPPGPGPARRGGDADGPCAEAQRLADERCELAARAHDQAADAEEAQRAAQRAYDEHEQQIAAAIAATDARGVRAAKDAAQARFRVARAGARTAEDIEAAAREWLQEINRINAGSAEAHGALEATRARLPELAARVERLAIAADTARIAAETADAACLAAREELADCEQREVAGIPSPGTPATEHAPGDDRDADTIAAALRAGASPRIIRLLRGDRAAMHEVVSALGGTIPEDRRRWQIAIADLIDAILADAIAASALEFPTDHPFWGRFTREQCREITSALSSLGYRFDGLGGWIDERVPSQRDLSLALGYAGLDPMRMRHWPTEDEIATLFAEVEVAGVEHLARAAGDLTLGELVTMLGRRADGLAEIWNSWGRIRPLLLDEAG